MGDCSYCSQPAGLLRDLSEGKVTSRMDFNGTLPVNLQKNEKLNQFSNGISIMQEAALAKPQTFITRDGWFTFNFIARVSQP